MCSLRDGRHLPALLHDEIQPIEPFRLCRELGRFFSAIIAESGTDTRQGIYSFTYLLGISGRHVSPVLLDICLSTRGTTNKQERERVLCFVNPPVALPQNGTENFTRNTGGFFQRESFRWRTKRCPPLFGLVYFTLSKTYVSRRVSKPVHVCLARVYKAVGPVLPCLAQSIHSVEHLQQWCTLQLQMGRALN